MGASRALLTQVVPHLQEVTSVLELGANTGVNLKAFREFFPDIEVAAIEINENAVDSLSQMGIPVLHGSLLSERFTTSFDLTFTSGVLIHIAPENLDSAYAALFEQSHRLILIAEYYSPRAEEINYRGHQRRMWRRDFAGDLLDKYPSLDLVAYGCTYHRAAPGLDDLNWFLLSKTSESV